MQELENWKTKTLLIGGVVGLLSGLFAAFLLIQRSDQNQQKPELKSQGWCEGRVRFIGSFKINC